MRSRASTAAVLSLIISAVWSRLRVGYQYQYHLPTSYVSFPSLKRKKEKGILKIITFVTTYSMTNCERWSYGSTTHNLPFEQVMIKVVLFKLLIFLFFGYEF